MRKVGPIHSSEVKLGSLKDWDFLHKESQEHREIATNQTTFILQLQHTRQPSYWISVDLVALIDYPVCVPGFAYFLLKLLF